MGLRLLIRDIQMVSRIRTNMKRGDKPPTLTRVVTITHLRRPPSPLTAKHTTTQLSGLFRLQISGHRWRHMVGMVPTQIYVKS